MIERFKSHSPSTLLILLLMWSAIYLMQLSVTSQISTELKIWIVASQDDNHRPEKHQTSQEHLQVGWKPFSRSSAILKKTQHTRLQRQPIPTKRVQLKLLTVILCYQSRLLFWKILRKILSFTLFLTKLLLFLISKNTRDSTTQTSNEYVFELSGNWQVSSAFKSTRVAEVSMRCHFLYWNPITHFTPFGL